MGRRTFHGKTFSGGTFSRRRTFNQRRRGSRGGTTPPLFRNGPAVAAAAPTPLAVIGQNVGHGFRIGGSAVCSYRGDCGLFLRDQVWALRQGRRLWVTFTYEGFFNTGNRRQGARRNKIQKKGQKREGGKEKRKKNTGIRYFPDNAHLQGNGNAFFDGIGTPKRKRETQFRAKAGILKTCFELLSCCLLSELNFPALYRVNAIILHTGFASGLKGRE